jgi:hypothetical protein
MLTKALLLVTAATVAALAVSPAEAKHRNHARHLSYRNGGGACDGFQRCRCGTTAARHFGVPYSYKGFNLKMASEWPRAFPHTSFQVGAAGVKPHHVLAIVGGSDCHNAMVYDDAGTRRRNVCGMTFVAVNGGTVEPPLAAKVATQDAKERRPVVTVSAKQHRRHFAVSQSQPLVYERRGIDSPTFTYVIDDGSHRGKYKSMKHRYASLQMQSYYASVY